MIRWILLLGVLVSVAPTSADVNVCSRYLRENPETARAIEFLKRYQGRYAFGSCQVELNVCGSYSEADDQGELAGELLVTDKRGCEFYVPFYFLREPSERFRHVLQNGRIMLHYKYEDRTANPMTMGAESIHLEILSQWDSPALKSIHLGYYLRKDFVERHHVHRYQWTICEEN